MEPLVCDTIWTQARILQYLTGYAVSIIEDGVIAVQGDTIVWVGKRADIPATLKQSAKTISSMRGALVTPGFIDCHTHLVYGGHCAGEFERRLQGATLSSFLKEGGSIHSIVGKTRLMTEPLLLQHSLERVDLLIKEGVTTIEIKSGYGLNLEAERKILRVASQIEQVRPVTVVKTFLGAHVAPLEYRNNRKEYIELIVDKMLPILHQENLVDMVDAYCEDIGFTPTEIEPVFEKAQQLHIPIKLDLGQLSHSTGVKLATKFNAISIGHGEHLTEEDIMALKKAGTVVVLLPGTYYTLGLDTKPPVSLLRRYGVPMAVASDHNPATSPVYSLQLMLNMSCQMFGLTPLEAIKGVTQFAAMALGLKDRGQIAPGFKADFVAWKVIHPAELSYRIASNPCWQVVKNGKLVVTNSS